MLATQAVLPGPAPISPPPRTRLGHDCYAVDRAAPRRALRALPQPLPPVRVLPLRQGRAGGLQAGPLCTETRLGSAVRRNQQLERVGTPVERSGGGGGGGERQVALLRAAGQSRRHRPTVMRLRRSHLNPSGVQSSRPITVLTVDAIPAPAAAVGDAGKVTGLGDRAKHCACSRPTAIGTPHGCPCRRSTCRGIGAW